jgi:hypothetical protein
VHLALAESHGKSHGKKTILGSTTGGFATSNCKGFTGNTVDIPLSKHTNSFENPFVSCSEMIRHRTEWAMVSIAKRCITG